MSLVLILVTTIAVGAPSLTLQGRILKPDGSPLNENSTQFRVRVMSPQSDRCILYDETQTLNLQGTDGLFTFTLNDGSGFRNDVLNSHDLAGAFSNLKSFAVDGSLCAAGGGTVTYSPAADDERKVIVYFKSPTMSTWEQMPESRFTSSAFALESRKVGGFAARALCRVEDPMTGPQSVAALTPANFTELMALVNGTSVQYTRTSSGAAGLPLLSANPGTLQKGQIWYDSGSNTIKFYNGSVQTVGASGAGLSSVSVGSGLTADGTEGGTLSSPGTIALKDTGVTAATYGSATQVPVFAVDAKGRITSVTNTTISGAAPTGTASGDLDGSYPNPTIKDGAVTTSKMFSPLATVSRLVSVGGVTGETVAPFTCSAGQVMKWDATNGWVCSTAWQNGTSGALYTTAGNVGIGTANPTSPLQVNSSATQFVSFMNSSLIPTAGLSDFSSIGGSSFYSRPNDGGIAGAVFGYTSSASKNNLAIVSRQDMAFVGYSGGTPVERMRIQDSSGNIGIGTTNPGAALDVAVTGTNSAIIVPRDSTTNRPTTLVNGMVRYNNTDNKFEFYQNGAWVNYGTTSGGGAAGDFMKDGSVAMTGTLKSIAGDATAPGLTVSGDTNTGIFAPAADNLAITTGGTERLRVLASGYVGIGTNNPTAKLTLQDGDLRFDSSNDSPRKISWRDSGGGEDAYIALDGTNASQRGTIDFFVARQSGGGGRIYFSDQDGSDAIFRIAHGKYGFGVGATEPVTTVQANTRTHVLQVSNNSYFTNNAYWDEFSGENRWERTEAAGAAAIGLGSTGFSIYTGSSSAAGTEVTEFATPKFTVMTDGKVGIGTTTPVTVLNVRGDAGGSSAAFAGGKPLLRLEGSGTWSEPAIDFAEQNLAPIASIAAKNTTGGAGDLIFLTRVSGNAAATENVRIKNNGNVGIGTNDPQYPLHVVRNGGTVGTTMVQLESNDSWGNGWYLNNTSPGGHNWLFYSFGSTSGQAGNFGIYDLTANKSRMTINTGGSVGIGTTNPGYKLDVVGDISASGCLRSSAGVASGTCVSDERLKTDLRPFDLGLEALLGITPHFFRYNGLAGHPASDQPELGVIAQEVEKTAPQLVVAKEVKINPEDSQTTVVKQVNYTAFTYVLINAVKDLYHLWFDDSQALHREIAALKDWNRELENRLRRQEAETRHRLDQIEKKLESK